MCYICSTELIAYIATVTFDHFSRVKVAFVFYAHSDTDGSDIACLNVDVNLSVFSYDIETIHRLKMYSIRGSHFFRLE